MKYNVYALYSCMKFVGEFEAKSADEAERMADESGNVNDGISVCHHCIDECGGEQPNFYKFHVEDAQS